MNQRKKINQRLAVSLAWLLLLSALLFGCDRVEPTPHHVALHQINVQEYESLTLEVGDSIQLITDAPTEILDGLTWTSSSSCVGITQDGTVIAQAVGTATVTVEYFGLSDSITVKVVLEIEDETQKVPSPSVTQPTEPESDIEPDSETSHEPAESEPDSSTDIPTESQPTESDPCFTEPDETPTEPASEPETQPEEIPTEPETEAIPPTVIIEAEGSPVGYKPAGSYEEALSRTQNGELSGYPYVPDQAPNISDYRPMEDGKYIKNNDPYYIDENTYVVVDAYGREVFRIYRGGAYITLEEVAAYVYAFGDVPANHSSSKNTKPTASVWGKYLRVNHTRFSGDTSRYPYEPVLPRISGCGGDLTYYEMDIGTTGTDCDPSYTSALYNNGSKITRGAARIVYARYDRNGNSIIDPDEKYVFYTYNHYNDFQEYLNYYGGWGEMFGNITGGGTISSKYDYNPTDYVPVVTAPLTNHRARILPVLYVEPATEGIKVEATVLHYDFRRYRTLAA